MAGLEVEHQVAVRIQAEEDQEGVVITCFVGEHIQITARLLLQVEPRELPVVDRLQMAGMAGLEPLGQMLRFMANALSDLRYTIHK
jgi:hypothetical protein